MPRHEDLSMGDLLKMRDFVVENGAFEDEIVIDTPAPIATPAKDDPDSEKLEQQRLNAVSETVLWHRPKSRTPSPSHDPKTTTLLAKPTG